jgi:hypothetical protein
MGLLEGIKKAFNMMPDLAGSIGRLALTIVILGLVIGVFIYQATTGGNINIDATSSALIGNTSANFSNFVGTVWDAVNSVTGFIVIAVILLIAGSIFGRKLLAGGKM